MQMLARIAIAAALSAASLAHADIYRCVDAQGNTSYSDSPCPRNAKSGTNVTEDVGACTTTQCEEQQRRQAKAARQRLRAEKEELNDLIAKHRQSDAEYERDRARAAEEQYRRSIEERLGAMADEAAQGANSIYYDYPGYPAYPIVTRPCFVCKPHPGKPPVNDTKMKKEPSVRLKLD
jgi:hypothetical protein